MKTYQLSIFVRIIILAVFSLACFSVIGRDNFLLGTFLILFRWVLFLIALLVFYLLYKRQSKRKWKTIPIATMLILLLELSWTNIGKESLKASGKTTEISFMTYNIFFKNHQPKSSINIIKKKNPDIIAIQELTPKLKQLLDKQLSSEYRYKKTLAMKGTHGLGIYSKYKITSNEFLYNSNNLPYAQVLTVSVNKIKMQVTNVHLASPAIAVENPNKFLPLYLNNYEHRKNQLARINGKADEEQFDAQILLGDLNTTHYEPLIRELESQWVDLHSVSGTNQRFNFPNSAKIPPILTLDYIFAKGKINPVNAEVLHGGGSDHFPIYGKVSI
ncbi:endonuclease/exonuclease/phosphatase family protein [Aureibacter tunicatorum]|uniref:Endonuclease/exonuclease/phosphatase (EEP) superfamily protein YafD n=1 Tax=Aureibacter tunicatorum TaxID=866807 RepID=A0AAE3XLW3_9BACT|nr:endonuclease/exonuclease/phosphatase family protein [Aureibacter tunicatorum]MDR6238837.1 endonuclease/exonuclease/phosphatase (EEP) superfamily protein YafD [Aureibacter tunicatorum]BDD05236.1 hypothetical protein AUTU_27190 [Aureibacter tunicatorum]